MEMFCLQPLGPLSDICNEQFLHIRLYSYLHYQRMCDVLALLKLYPLQTLSITALLSIAMRWECQTEARCFCCGDELVLVPTSMYVPENIVILNIQHFQILPWEYTPPPEIQYEVH